MAAPAPLENVRPTAISHAGTAFGEYAMRQCDAPLQESLFEWADRSSALKCLRHATYEASIDALKESRAYLSPDEYTTLARTVLAPFIAEYVTRCLGEALTNVFREAVKSPSA